MAQISYARNIMSPKYRTILPLIISEMQRIKDNH